MQVEIYKYKEDISKTDTENNYFHPVYNKPYEDFIIIDKLLKIPIFREELNDEEDFNSINTGDFDLEISLLQDIKSNQGKNLLDFFEFGTGTINRFKYMVIIGGIEGRAGIINYAEMEYRFSYNKNDYQIEIPVIGIIKEFADYFKEKLVRNYIGNPSGSNILQIVNIRFPIKFYLSYLHFISYYKFEVDVSNLDFVNRIGFEPILSGFLQEIMWRQNSYYEQNYNFNIFDTFISIATEFGFIFKLVPIRFRSGEGYEFKLECKFRTYENVITKDLKILSRNSKILFNRNYYLFFENRKTQSNDIKFGYENIQAGVGKIIGGFLISSDLKIIINNYVNYRINPITNSREYGFWNQNIFLKEVITSGGTKLNDEKNLWYWDNVSRKFIPYNWGNIFKVEHRYLYYLNPDAIWNTKGRITAEWLSYGRLFVYSWEWNNKTSIWIYSDSGTETILNHTINQYLFLLNNMKLIKEVDVIQNDINEYKLFDFVKLNGNARIYYINRINNIDLEKQISNLELIEL